MRARALFDVMTRWSQDKQRETTPIALRRGRIFIHFLAARVHLLLGDDVMRV